MEALDDVIGLDKNVKVPVGETIRGYVKGGSVRDPYGNIYPTKRHVTKPEPSPWDDVANEFQNYSNPEPEAPSYLNARNIIILGAIAYATYKIYKQQK